ncbi:MAG: sigma-70 family RNA polymerase sigma factor [Firmicutes bacterium]|nr:sigma-70 family RNA polymerase sigma factor [Bacillota bacterium]
MDTKQLIKRAKKGNKEALVKLIMAQEKEYYKLAYVYMKNKDDALDALEDMILVLYENIGKLRNEDKFYSWSKTILVNRCKKILKDRSKVVLIDGLSSESYEGNLYRKEDQILLDKHMSKLSEKHQEVLKLRYFLDLEYNTISEMLKVPLGTVKSRISIGLNKLKESLGGEGYERG